MKNHKLNYFFVITVLHFLFSNCEVEFNNTMVYETNGLSPHEAQITNELNSSSLTNKGILACHRYTLEQFPEALDVSRSQIEPISQEQG